MSPLHLLQIVLLSFVQGLCELLPVSSSAHVLVAAKLMGIDPTSPEMTFLLVMLHTGTMFAVIVYFWRAWRKDYFGSQAAFWLTVKQVAIATVATGVVGIALKQVVEKVFLHGRDHAEVEMLFGNLPLIAAALAAVGLLILIAGRSRSGDNISSVSSLSNSDVGVNTAQATWIGVVQGLCLPFRGFSRSGATISTGLLVGVTRVAAERFSFALAVVLTPPVIAREALRLMKHSAASVAAHAATTPIPSLSSMMLPGLIGMVCAFAAGLLALRWLSGWLEHGRWQWFGGYCLLAATVVFWLSTRLPG